ncbi:GMC family oxidoreductase [Halomicroarcula sp. GCM10025817]|uniref:GMC family oxidoreductase n=1 Tax=Halomicroarcula sp. GCM10025817 TaxID=3252672 RepID=UPI00360B0C5E
MSIPDTLVTFTEHQAETATALFERLFPADEDPGAEDIGVTRYVDRALDGPYEDQVRMYRLGLDALDRNAEAAFGREFAQCDDAEQDELLSRLQAGDLEDFETPPQTEFFGTVRTHLQEGLFADPVYGGNEDKKGWEVLGHPGVYLENSAAENLAEEPVTKDGDIQSMADLGFDLDSSSDGDPAETEGYDPQRGAAPPAEEADVVLAGVGAMGGLIAPVLAEAGLDVVAFEAGPWRTRDDYLPDELGHSYYCRANMGKKFDSETPRWRRNEGEDTQEATFSLGRMMNSVGGSVIHYGAWLRRFHPHHFRQRSYVEERWGEDVLPDNCTLTDWPLSYEELEPYYTRLEHEIGIAGGDANPYVSRSEDLPMPPLRRFRMGEDFREVTESMDLNPYMVPVGMNSEPYDGRPATTYTAWNNGFGSFNDAKWHPGLTHIPRALETGNFDLRTHCRVVEVLTDEDGEAAGVQYIDANGEQKTQKADNVILSAYSFENVRLLLNSTDDHHPNGLGNNTGQVGKHFMTKMFAHVNGYFPDDVFNRHTGPAAQGIILDDYLSTDFDSVERGGFVGGATLGSENQYLPIQISQESLPEDVPAWGQGYKDHLRDWQHVGTVRIQSTALPYSTNYLELDPDHRDTSGVGMPVLRITYDMRENEQRLHEWMEDKSAEILEEMGASKTWRGPRFTGVGSSHDLGGCRMGEDPETSVVDPNLEVHDTPGLHVYSGAAFPTCPGINPTLTMWAICLRAAENLVDSYGA